MALVKGANLGLRLLLAAEVHRRLAAELLAVVAAFNGRFGSM